MTIKKCKKFKSARQTSGELKSVSLNVLDKPLVRYPCQIVWGDVDGAKFDDPQPCNNPTWRKTSHTTLYANRSQTKPAWYEPSLHLYMQHRKSMKKNLLSPEKCTAANLQDHNIVVTYDFLFSLGSQTVFTVGQEVWKPGWEWKLFHVCL